MPRDSNAKSAPGSDAKLTAAQKRDVLKQTALNSIAAQIMVIDGKGNVIAVNRTWEKHLGTGTSASLDVAGRASNYLDACRHAHSEGREGAAQVVESIVAVLEGNAASGRVEYRGHAFDGHEQWFALTVTPLSAGAGAVLFHEDISVQRQLEGEILEISERERAQVGQELHDGLCQHLSGVALLARTLSNALVNARRPEAGQAQELEQLILSAVEQIRVVARGLRPVELDEGGLVAALSDLAEQANTRLRCELRTTGHPRVNDNEIATNLYRIANEALANAVRYSFATRVVIRLRQSADHLTLAIEDDGIGILPAREGPDGMGLRIMRYRANSIGARFNISPRVPRGTIVSCSVPLAIAAGALNSH
ncbi:MAG: PAS domain-containing sensor histidine kinase [Chthoniobacteraceae bacterium]